MALSQESKSRKLKLGFLNSISAEWVYLYKDSIEQVSRVDDADYIIYESNGDPVPVIMNILATFPRKKLVFILSGDQSAHINDECIWFSNAVKPSGLAARQTQIFVSNPAIFKYYEKIGRGFTQIRKRYIDIYFKGTIWNGMREAMYDYFSKSRTPEMSCLIEKNNDYWGWRLNNKNKPTQEDIEKTAYKSYETMEDALLCLCPKGNGNSSMRIVEALACGSIPVLIDDFSAPFDVLWEDAGVALTFDTHIHTWNHIYTECYKLIQDTEKLKTMQKKGNDYFREVVYGDSNSLGFKMYGNLDTVAFGFSGMILERLRNMLPSNS
jgi:hypothetical protein